MCGFVQLPRGGSTDLRIAWSVSSTASKYIERSIMAREGLEPNEKPLNARYQRHPAVHTIPQASHGRRARCGWGLAAGGGFSIPWGRPFVFVL